MLCLRVLWGAESKWITTWSFDKKTTLEIRWPLQTACFSEEKADSCLAITAERGWAKYFFLPWNACLHCWESKADFSVAPGRAGGRGRARRAEPECVQRSVQRCESQRRAALLRVGTCPAVLGVSSGHWEPPVPAGDAGPLMNHKGLGSAREMGMGREGGRD